MRQPPGLGALFTFLLVLGSGPSCTPELQTPRESPRLVVLYAPCSVSKGHLSPYTKEVFYTPNLAEFARSSHVFEAHQTEAGQSGIAYASLFSGTQALEHGIYGHPTRLSDDVTLISEYFGDASYDLFFWNRHSMADRELNYAQGVPVRHYFDDLLSGDDRRLTRILDRLARDPSYRVLIISNFHVSHAPYPDRIDSLRARFPEQVQTLSAGLSEEDIAKYTALQVRHVELGRDFQEVRERLGLDDDALRSLIQVLELLYASDISYLDTLFGSVLEAIDARGLRETSIVVFTADHGEVLYRDNAIYKWTHGFALAPEVLGVPLIIRAPGVEPARNASVTRSIDVFPTLAVLAGLPMPSSVSGVDLSHTLLDGALAPKLLAFSHTSKVRSDLVHEGQVSWKLFSAYFPSTEIGLIWVAVRDRDRVYKLRRTLDGEFVNELFDLAQDPEERENLFDPTDPLHRQRADMLADYKAKLVFNYRQREEPPELGSEELENLRNLGYIE